MERLLRFNASAMFSLLFIAPFVLPFLIRHASFLPADVNILALTLINILGTLLYCAWVYAACTKLSTLLPQGIPLTTDRIKILLLLPVISTLWGPLAGLLGIVSTGTDVFYWLTIILGIASLCAILYSIFYMARLLKTVEYERPVAGSDCVGDFLRILFFPFGIWNIQPRLNDAARMVREDMDIFKQDQMY
jgi:hypothetical protein